MGWSRWPAARQPVSRRHRPACSALPELGRAGGPLPRGAGGGAGRHGPGPVGPGERAGARLGQPRRGGWTPASRRCGPGYAGRRPVEPQGW